MKKFFAIAFVAASLAACGGGESTEGTKTEGGDTSKQTVAPVDTNKQAAPADTNKQAAPADTNKKAAPADTAKKDAKKVNP